MHDLEHLQDLEAHRRHEQQQQHLQQEQEQVSTASQQADQLQQQVPQPQVLQLPPQLVLRRWHDLLPEREFRCFVCGHRMVAISQRDPSQHFPQLGLPGELESIRTRVMEFHEQRIGSSFPVDSCK